LEITFAYLAISSPRNVRAASGVSPTGEMPTDAERPLSSAEATGFVVSADIRLMISCGVSSGARNNTLVEASIGGPPLEQTVSAMSRLPDAGASSPAGPATGVWMGAAFGTALMLAILVLAKEGTDSEGIKHALRVTARCSFLFFWMAYAGGPLAVLFGPTFRALAERGRQFGLAFASAHLVHAGLVLWLYQISVRPPVGTRTLVFFGVALFWTYLLALFSIPKLSGVLPSKVWRIIRAVGVEYIALAFLVDFGRNPFWGSALEVFAYLPFLALCAIGPVLRLAAFIRRHRARDRTQAPVVMDVAAASGLESAAYLRQGDRP
jgi:hypothetical protein